MERRDRCESIKRKDERIADNGGERSRRETQILEQR